MPLLQQTVEIRAAPEAVFDLIAQVEGLSDLTEVIKEVRATGPDTYHWKVKAAGVSLEWDGRITERERPHRLSWRSISGIANGGTYLLQPSERGTLVSLSLEYHLHNRVMERIIARVADPLVRRVGAQVLSNVKARLENSPSGRGAPSDG
jgi:uncharacterized membrane protein